MPAASSRVISRREPRRQAASARRSERVWSAKARNVRPTGSVTSSSDGASSACATFSPGPPPSIMPMPMPPRIAERSRCGWLARQHRRHPRAQRIAHDIGALDVQMIHQRDDVAGHDGDLIVRGIVELAGIAMAAIVERDDAAAVFLQLRNPGRIDPVDVLARGKAVHEQDRIALAFVEIGNFDSAVVKTRHHHSVFWRDRRWAIGSGRKSSRARRRPPEPRLAAMPRPPPACAAAAPSCGAARPGSAARWWP